MNKLLNSLVKRRAPRLGQAWALGMGIGLFWSGSAIAAETVTFRYNELEFGVSTPELRVFAETGEITSPLIRLASRQYPEIADKARLVLNQSVALEGKVEKEIGSTIIGSAVLEQLDKLLDDATGQDNTEPIQSAILAAYADDQVVSLVEIIEEYPEDNIVVNLSNLEQVYSEALAVIERVQPALGVLQDVLDILGAGS
ncbi:MAG: alpha/beta hydrolase [Thainema sp.]